MPILKRVSLAKVSQERILNWNDITQTSLSDEHQASMEDRLRRGMNRHQETSLLIQDFVQYSLCLTCGEMGLQRWP